MRTTALILLALLSVTALGGCKKSSKEYFEAQRRFDSLTAQEGDDAYLMPEMEQVSQTLAAVPTRAFEYDRAQALLAKISAEKARVAQERASAVVVKPADEPQVPDFRRPEAVAIPSAAAVDPFDGGVPELVPTGGMPEALFKEQFGDCVSGPQPIKVDGQGEVPAYQVNETAPCFKKLKVEGPSRFFFVNGALAGRLSSTRTVTRTILDGGAGGTVEQPPTQFLVVPGAPLPPGAAAPTAPAPGTLPAGSTGDGMQPTKAEGDLGARPQP
ncbi:MAG: hypothetical protein JNJ54_17820 [Myxococcaceae bacterium]|nr:hypothetical protein [Myxococcaceae bacterium]